MPVDEPILVERRETREALQMSSAYVPPRTDFERRLADLWAERLQVDSVGVEDDFFELGGDSMLAAEMQLTVDREFGVEIPAAELFLSPTIATLSEAVHNAAPSDDPHR